MDLKRAQSLVGTSEGRPEADFYPTPNATTEALFTVESFDGLCAWEPACGDGSMSDVLKRHFSKVISSDLYPYGYPGAFYDQDFLMAGLPVYKHNGFLVQCNTIITNPPFSLAEDFVRHAIFDLKISKLALLCKLQFLEGQKRSVLLEKTGLTRVWVFRARQSLYRNGLKMKNSGMIAFAWFVWERGYSGSPVLGWI